MFRLPGHRRVRNRGPQYIESKVHHIRAAGRLRPISFRGTGMSYIDANQFRVKEGKTVDLDDAPTRVAPFYDSKGDYKQKLRTHVNELADLQYQLYASNQFALLIIFQAMDAAGKDGAIKHVMSGVNPQGTQVYS